MVEKTKSAYKLWVPIRRNMPRTEQFGIGTKIDTLFLELLDYLRAATYAGLAEKIALLGRATVKTDSLRFFVQLAWETKLLSSVHFDILGAHIEETGRMVGGWRKGLITKTSPPKSGEEKKA